MFSTYFSGINQHDYQQALSVFDPSGEIDPSDPQLVRAFSDGLATTTDSDVVLSLLQPTGDGSVGEAKIMFQSQQGVGYGPKDDPNETCTLWNITYILDQSSSGQYQIYREEATTNSGCQ
jgi:hypothetical protein